MKTIYIVSFFGIGNKGGVERVCYYLYDILGKKFDVKIITAPLKNIGKIGFILNPILISVRLFFTRNRFVISNSWQMYPFPSDLSIHHGTTKGYLISNTEKGTFGENIISLLEKISAKKAKRIIAVSSNCKQELIDLYKIPVNKIKVLNNFVDESIFFPCEKNKNAKLKVLFVGSLSERKGLSHLINFAKYLEGREDVEFLIATNSNLNVNLFNSYKNTKIHIGLKIAEMATLYRSSDVLYFPTNYEGFSMSTLEALASGIPVIGSKFAVTEELQKFNFCKEISNFAPDYVINEIIKLCYENTDTRRFEIHNQTIADFGKTQYLNRLYRLLEEVV